MYSLVQFLLPIIPPSLPSSYQDLDHTADLQIHAWAPTIPTAIIQAGYGVIEYMTDRHLINPKHYKALEIPISRRNGDDGQIDWSLVLHDWLEMVLGCFYGGIPISDSEDTEDTIDREDEDDNLTTSFVIGSVDEGRVEINDTTLTFHW